MRSAAFWAGCLSMNRMPTIAMAPSGRLMKKHHRQVALSLKTPPTSGPTTDATPYMLPSNAEYFGRLTGGTLKAIMMKLPAKIPAEPRPEIARPTMRVIELGATPQTKLPISKIVMEHKYAYLRL